jgi:hypothetical protein
MARVQYFQAKGGRVDARCDECRDAPLPCAYCYDTAQRIYGLTQTGCAKCGERKPLVFHPCALDLYGPDCGTDCGKWECEDCSRGHA